MSTTPLPSNTDGAAPCIVRWVVEMPAGWLGAYNKEAFDAYAQQARADLEAEVARLREALTQTADALSLAQTDVHWELHSPTRKVLRKAELAARAALKGTP